MSRHRVSSPNSCSPQSSAAARFFRSTKRAHANNPDTEPRVSPGSPWHRGSKPQNYSGNTNRNVPQRVSWQRREFQDPHARFIQARPRCPESRCGEPCSRVPLASHDSYAHQCLAGPSSCPVSPCETSGAKPFPSFFLPSWSPRRQPISCGSRGACSGTHREVLQSSPNLPFNSSRRKPISPNTQWQTGTRH